MLTVIYIIQFFLYFVNSVMFDDLYSGLIDKFPEIETVGIDSGYIFTGESGGK